MSTDERSPDDSADIRGLLSRIQAGDEEAARELLTRYEAKVRLVVRRQLPRILRSRFDSLDFLQSLWGSFFHRIRTGPNDLEGEGNLIAFLAWAAKNKVIDEYRRAATQRQDIHRHQHARIEEVDRNGIARPEESPSQRFQALETFGRLNDLLPEDRRIILELKAAGYSSLEIGERLGISERTVQRLLEDLRSRARIEG